MRHMSEAGTTGARAGFEDRQGMSMQGFRRGAAAVSLLAAFAGASAAETRPQVLGEFEAWKAMKAQRSDGVVCYAMSTPRSTAPKGAKRDPIYFLVSNFPAGNVKGEPSIVIGYPFKDGSTATVEIGGRKFDFATVNEGTDGSAWLPDRGTEKQLVAAMRAGSRMVVKGTSRRGTNTTDEYSLAGISAALDAIETCE